MRLHKALHDPIKGCLRPRIAACCNTLLSHSHQAAQTQCTHARAMSTRNPGQIDTSPTPTPAYPKLCTCIANNVHMPCAGPDPCPLPPYERGPPRPTLQDRPTSRQIGAETAMLPHR